MPMIDTSRLFFSYPADVIDDIKFLRGIINEENMRWEQHQGIAIRCFDFHDITPGRHPKGTQQYINEMVDGKYDIYVGLIRQTFGRRSGHFGSGTEEEYFQAVRSHEEKGTPTKIIFGFANEKISSDEINLKEIAKIRDFRKKIGSNQLYFQWRTRNELGKKLVKFLDSIVVEFGRDPGRSVHGGARYE